jgi:hypothetical protein
MIMVWHILKKDVRLLWVFALVMATIHLAAAALRSWLGVFPEPSQLVVIADFLSLLSLLGIVVLTIALMHEDAVPGVRQDWLTRPIDRADLIFAKLLFVMLMVQAPLLLADVSEALLDGFSFQASLGAAAARNVAILCFFSLPALMLGAVTRNLMESFGVAVMGLVVYAVVFLLGTGLLLGVRTSVGGTGLLWMFGATWYALAVAGAAIVISLQFFRRKTTIARCLIGVGGAVIILSSFLPWRAAFALQVMLSKEPSSADAVELAFNPQLGSFNLPPGAAPAISAGLYLPLRVTGVPASAVMLMDRADIHITDIHGSTLYEGRSNLSVDGVGSIRDARLEVRQRDDGDTAADVHQRIFIPAAIYARLKDQSVRLQIDYSLTLLRAAATYSMPASGGAARLQGLGWCSTRIDGEGDDVQLRCLNTRRTPSCVSAFLQHGPSALRNPEAHVCDPDYMPVATNFWPDALSRLAGEVPFFDRSGLTHYPVDGSKLVDSQLVVKIYEPRDHFTRHLNIPTIRLSEFAAAAAVPAALR